MAKMAGRYLQIFGAVKYRQRGDIQGVEEPLKKRAIEGVVDSL